jgi:hypothetical protein
MCCAVITMVFSENLCGYGTTRWSGSCVGVGHPFGSVDQRNYHVSVSGPSDYSLVYALLKSESPDVFSGTSEVEQHQITLMLYR